MLARLSRTCSQLTDFGWSVSSRMSNDLNVEDGEVMDYGLLPPEAQFSLIMPENALESVAGACGKMFSPLCRFAGSVLSTDVERVIMTLHEADPNFSADLKDEDNPEDIYVIPFPSSDGTASDPRLSSRESSDACKSDSSLSNPASSCARGVERASEPSESVPQNLRPISIPRIVITLAPCQEWREMSSCVPVQDTSFGARLTVPAHTALNACHPPMRPPSTPYMPLYTTIRAWTYKQGHWCAVIPGLDEQERRGIFSRPVNPRRRAMRKRMIAARDHAISCQNMFARNKRDS